MTQHTPSIQESTTIDVPFAGHTADNLHGHWVLARLGKRVLRPGGIELTHTLLAHARVHDVDVVEFAPGLGRTAAEIVKLRPRSYRGVDQDPTAARTVGAIVAGIAPGLPCTVHHGHAGDTGLPGASADAVIGEAMLTMQGDKSKAAIIGEAFRLLRPGGRYAIHELALTPDTLGDDVKTSIRTDLARSIKVNARPLTIAEWRDVLTAQGFVVDYVETAPMALLEPRRIVSDEGLAGALRFARNLLTNRDARGRVLAMRRTFRAHRDNMAGVVLIARRPHED